MCVCCVCASWIPHSRWGTYIGRIAYMLEMKIYDYLNACNRNVCSGWITQRPSSQPLWLLAKWQALGSWHKLGEWATQRNIFVHAFVGKRGRWKCSLALADINDHRRCSRKVDNERRAWLNTSVDLGALASSMRTQCHRARHSVCIQIMCHKCGAVALLALFSFSRCRERALVYCGNSHKWQLRVDLCIRGVQLEIICRPFSYRIGSSVCPNREFTSNNNIRRYSLSKRQISRPTMSRWTGDILFYVCDDNHRRKRRDKNCHAFAHLLFKSVLNRTGTCLCSPFHGFEVKKKI